MSNGSGRKMLDVIRQYVSGEIPPPPVAKLLGFSLIAADAGTATVEFEATDRHANPMGTLHGGVLCDIADAAMGIAFATLLDQNESFTTLELKINFLKPIWNARLQAVAKVVKKGRTIGLVQCDVTDENNELVARATSTCMTLSGVQAEGR